jgi:hypothetical protein
MLVGQQSFCGVGLLVVSLPPPPQSRAYATVGIPGVLISKKNKKKRRSNRDHIGNQTLGH